MRILNISTLKLNDSHNYFGGAIGNIAYNQLRHLAVLDEISIDTTAVGIDFNEPLPESISVNIAEDYKEVESYVEKSLAAADVVTHLYFHEPEYNPVSKTIAESAKPFVIGMCEVPHPRFKDEVSGLGRLPLVRRVGRRLIKPRFKRTLMRADCLVVVDEHAKEYYAQYYPREDIEVVPYGVSLERFVPSPFPDTPRVLMVNRLIKRRGVQHMIKAFQQVNEKLPEAELHVVGEGPRRKWLSAQTEDLGVAGAVTFHGNVAPQELIQRYAESTVFAHLSFADGWNQPALEAMASGRPVVCTDKPHNSMVLDSVSGYKVPWADHDAVAERLIDLLTNRGRVAALGRAARETVEDSYAWPTIAERYRTILESVCTATDG